MPQVSGEKEFFANLVVDAVLRLDLQTLDLRMIGMKKVRLWLCGASSGTPGCPRPSRWSDPASRLHARALTSAGETEDGVVFGLMTLLSFRDSTCSHMLAHADGGVFACARKHSCNTLERRPD